MDATTAAIIRREAERQATEGNRQAALDLLASVPGPGEGAATAILRAKILSQRGEFTRAADSWRDALSADPGNDEAARGLALAENLARSPVGRLRLRARLWLLVTAGVVATAALVWAAAAAVRAPSPREVAGRSSPAERQQAEDQRAAASRTDATIRELRQAIEANQSQLRSFMAEQTRASGQAREQLRRLDRRTSDVLEAVRRLNKSAAERPSGDR